jgi:hypothetical protein
LNPARRAARKALALSAPRHVVATTKKAFDIRDKAIDRSMWIYTPTIPPLGDIRRISLAIAVSVAECAYEMNLARAKRPRRRKHAIARFMYEP